VIAVSTCPDLERLGRNIARSWIECSSVVVVRSAIKHCVFDGRNPVVVVVDDDDDDDDAAAEAIGGSTHCR
jgi:hypothetical protein